jgi:transcriptional/translational regulatory protein YebC/TACO1
MNYNIVDIIDFDNALEVITTPNDFYQVKDLLLNKKCIILQSEVKLIPQNKITNLASDLLAKIDNFIIACNDDDDIQ